MAVKCPKCEKLVVSALRAEVTEAKLPAGFNYASLKMLVISCPLCSTILGTSIEPLAFKSEIVNGVVAKLKSATTPG